MRKMALSPRPPVVLAVAMAIGLFLTGCITVSPHFEVVDRADQFIEAASAGDFSAVRELTLGWPDGWERALEVVAPAWCYSEVAGVDRSGDRAQVRVQSEPVDAVNGDWTDPAQSQEREYTEWVIELVRVEGVWFVDLAMTLAPD